MALRSVENGAASDKVQKLGTREVADWLGRKSVRQSDDGVTQPQPETAGRGLRFGKESKATEYYLVPQPPAHSGLPP